MGDDDSIAEHSNVFNIVVTQLNSIGVNMDEEDCPMALLCSFPSIWDNLVMVVGSIAKTLALNEIMIALLS